MAIATSS
nr:unnamed protein product [Callosobruchus chinensis]